MLRKFRKNPKAPSSLWDDLTIDGAWGCCHPGTWLFLNGTGRGDFTVKYQPNASWRFWPEIDRWSFYCNGNTASTNSQIISTEAGLLAAVDGRYPPHTIFCRFNPSALDTSSSNYLYVGRQYTSNEQRITLYGGKVRYYRRSAYIDTPNSYDVGKWNWCAATITSTTSYYAWLNGQVSTEGTTSASQGVVMSVNWGSGDNMGYWRGYMADPMFWNRVLSEQELLWLADPSNRLYVPDTRTVFYVSSVQELIVAGSTHGHTAAAPTLTATGSLAVAGAAHSHTADGLTLTVAANLALVDATHGHTADSPTLTAVANLATADASHAHAADSVALTAAVGITVADSSHGHTIDAPALTGSSSLVAADAAHRHTADTPTLATAVGIVPDDASHVHTTDSPTLTSAVNLTAAGATHGHTADGLALSLLYSLAADSATHSHTSDEPILSIVYQLTPAESSHQHTAGEPPLSVVYSLAPEDATHPHTAETVVWIVDGVPDLLLLSAEITTSFAATATVNTAFQRPAKINRLLTVEVER